MQENKFVMLPFRIALFSKPFRYKGQWWFKEFYPTKGGKIIRKKGQEIPKEIQAQLFYGHFIKIEDEELVGMKSSILTDIVIHEEGMREDEKIKNE